MCAVVRTYGFAVCILANSYVRERERERERERKIVMVCIKNGTLFYFSSYQYTVDSNQMFDTNKFLPMTGFKLWTSGIGSDHSTN